ncbi:MAG TPA: hypothetical protein VF136_02120, partial [Methylomirabilota bacterium]
MARLRQVFGAFVAAAAAMAVWPAAGAQEGGTRAVNWDRALATIASYRTILDISGLVEVDARIPAVDAEDLGALCDARQTALRLARSAGEADLMALGPFRDPITDARRADVLRYLGTVAIFDGRVDEALARFTAGREALAPYVDEYADLRPKAIALEEALGVAAMRRGETENCLVNPSADRCLFPLREGGRHHAPAGAAAALEHFTRVLDADPENLEARWLLN